MQKTPRTPPASPLKLIADAIVVLAESNMVVADKLGCICREMHGFNKRFFAVLDFGLSSVPQQGDSAMISPVQIGDPTGRKYRISLVPANAAPLSSGPTASTSTTGITLTQDPADPFLVTAVADASVTGDSFPLQVDGVNGVGNPLTHTFTIPLSAAPPPQAVDFDLNDA